MNGTDGIIRWGLMGVSRIGRRLAPKFAAAPGAQLAAVASRDPLRARAFARELRIPRAHGSYGELLADPGVDAVYIALPNGLQAAWTAAAIRAGKHVLVEKAALVDPAGVDEVRAALTERNVCVTEGFMWRFHPQHALAREWIAAGRIGAIRQFRGAFTTRTQPDDPANCRLRPELGGGALTDIGCYLVSGARFYLGEPRAVLACAVRYPEFAVDMGWGILFEHEGGAQAALNCHFLAGYHAGCEIVGEHACIELPLAWTIPERQPAVVRLCWRDRVEETVLPPADHFALEIGHFNAAIRGVEPLRYGFADMAAQAAVLEAVRRSDAAAGVMGQ